jgi:hypothetical protein
MISLQHGASPLLPNSNAVTVSSEQPCRRGAPLHEYHIQYALATSTCSCTCTQFAGHGHPDLQLVPGHTCFTAQAVVGASTALQAFASAVHLRASHAASRTRPCTTHR